MTGPAPDPPAVELTDQGEPRLSARPMEVDEVGRMVDYFHDSDDDFLDRLGVDPDRLPDRDRWRALVQEDMARPLADQESYYLLWEVDGVPVGHCNLTKIDFGRHAFLHLHVWEEPARGRGIGTRLLTESVRHFCQLFELEVVYSEPHSSNPAPNKTMARVGFELERTYETTPGWINFNQLVNRWRFDCGPKP